MSNKSIQHATMKINSLNNIPVIDLFAGPGGLGEGFSAFTSSNTIRPFKVGVSVEMDTYAHKTLELRSFFHEFSINDVPEAYYQYLRREITRDELFNKFPKQAASAKRRAMLATLGTDDDKMIRSRIKEVLSYYDNSPWVLVGGPPCQAYSLIGRARRQANGSGKVVQQQDERNFLYLEYLKIIAEFSPDIFVMENVKGMLSAVVDGERIVHKIFQDLRDPKNAIEGSASDANVHSNFTLKGYTYKIYSLVVPSSGDKELDPSKYLIKSELYGIPQTRHRVILLGVRSDINSVPKQLVPASRKVTVREVIGDLPAIRSQITRIEDSNKVWYDFILSLKETEWLRDYAPTLQNGRNVDAKLLKKRMNEALDSLINEMSPGSQYMPGESIPGYKTDWFYDERIRGVANHSARAHMKKDLERYFFSSVYAQIYGVSPRMKDFPKQLLPKHRNVDLAISKGIFSDRFRVQSADNPGATITCHISKDGHYSIHYDPRQCRSLTVREAARIQTFPDNYFFEGPRTQQLHQVGNAVPPLLANQIAGVVYELISRDEVAKRSSVKKSIQAEIAYE